MSPMLSVDRRAAVDMGSHIAYDRLMKTTIEIADDLFERVQRLAREQKTTFRALTETGLRMVLSGRQRRRLQKASLLVTYGKGGLSEEFKDSYWERIRTEIYRGRGA